MSTRFARVAVVATLVACFGLPGRGAAQEPVTKPRPEPRNLERLPAPAPTARQGPDGRITVTWAPVEGAVAYRLLRSVPPAGQTAIALPNQREPGYVDADVQAGRTYYYLVSAVNAAGVEGLRAGTPPIMATISAGSPTPANTTSAPAVSVRLLQPDPPRLEIQFSGFRDALDYTVERRLFSALPGDPTTLNRSSPTVTRSTQATPWFQDSLPSAPYARAVVYLVTPRLLMGTGRTMSSAEIALPAAPTTGGGPSTNTGSSTNSPVASAPVGSTTLTVATPVTVPTGGTVSVSAAVGSAARWLSLDESIATVDANGSVTGRSVGRARIVALSAASGGSLRVVAIAVEVKP